MFHYILIGIAVGFIAGVFANKYGKNPVFWFWLCLVFPFAILFLFLQGDQQEKQANEYTECPYCAELIKKKAKVCKHCGRDVIPKEIEIK